MSSCSEVSSCLSEGSTVCILTSGQCPPCVYALSGGDYSCYSRDTSGDCPFSGSYAECDKDSSTTSSKTSTSSEESSNSDTPPPTTKTKAPAKTTATPTATTATTAPETVITAPETVTTAPETATTAPETTTSSSTGSNTNSGETSSTGATTTPSDTTASDSGNGNQTSQTATSGSNGNQASQSDSSSSGAEKALTSNTATTTGSPAVVNLALIGAAVVLVVIVIAFVARRVVTKKKKMYHTQDRTVSSHNSQWSDRTLDTGGASAGNLYSTYSYKDEAGKGNGISMMSDSQASSTGYDQSMNSASSPRSTADFSNYGDESQYAANSQYYNDYSVSAGPELAAGAVAGKQHPYVTNTTVPLSSGGTNNFVNATSMANRESSFGSVRQHPLTVSQLMDSSIEEDEDQAYAGRRLPAPQFFQEPTAYNAQPANPPVPPSTRKPQIFATSTASSMRSDYDIVDPITMQDVEARNTEMLAEDGRYPKFSFESEAASDVYDESSSEEESDDERVRPGEHTI